MSFVAYRSSHARILVGKSCSSLGASSLKNLSAVGSRHSLSETVLHLSLSLLRLVGSFHEWHLLYSFRWGLRGLNVSFRAYSYKDILYYI